MLNFCVLEKSVLYCQPASAVQCGATTPESAASRSELVLVRTGTPGSGHTRLRSALVVAEIAVALTLLTASGLLLRSFEKMRDVDLGFRPDNTLAALYVLPQQRYRTQSAIDEFTKTLLNDLGQLPGVDAVGITSFLPAAGNNWSIPFTIESDVSPKGAGLNMAAMSLVEGPGGVTNAVRR